MENFEIRCVIKFLWKTGKSNAEIAEAIIAAYGEGVVSSRTIRKWTLKFMEGDFTLEDKARCGRPKDQSLRLRVQEQVESCPYSSAREIAKRIGCDKNSATKILRIDLGMSKVNFRWIPKELTCSQKAKRVEVSKEMLSVLMNKHQHNLVYTQDETWIRWKNPRKTMWLMSGAERPKEEKQLLGAKKLMISVIFNVDGVVSVVALPRGQKFTKQFFYDVVISDFIKKVKIPKSKDQKRKVKFHCDNAPVHAIDGLLEESNIPRFPHPPYSPDLAPCDFFLFGYLKNLLEGRNFESDEGLLQEVQSVLKTIPQATFQRTYNEWVQRLHRCVEQKVDGGNVFSI